ncbi:MAG: SDR family NAD(P)-dependent oxidoreductase [Acidimicrobiales bacterium]|nr:SDR family NAD(P)-dependent oxidoreductase [Acidimicrobiales bacterium]
MSAAAAKVVVVTGANSGIGRAAAVHLAAAGHTVYGTMRDLAKGDKLLAKAADVGAIVNTVALDVADDDSVASGMEQILHAEGHVDVLINNAGVGMNAVLEEVDIEAAKDVFDVNYFGIVRCTQAVLPTMRERRTGTIVNISSIAGRLAALAQVIYASSKWAVECLSENLAQELAPWNIKVRMIEPGVTRTALLAKHTDLNEGSPYADAYRRMFAFYMAGIEAGVGADVVAQTIAGAIDDPSDRLRYVCAYGGEELGSGRDGVSDADWVALGAAGSDEEYFERFRSAFGLDIAPST